MSVSGAYLIVNEAQGKQIIHDVFVAEIWEDWSFLTRSDSIF